MIKVYNIMKQRKACEQVNTRALQLFGLKKQKPASHYITLVTSLVLAMHMVNRHLYCVCL